MGGTGTVGERLAGLIADMTAEDPTEIGPSAELACLGLDGLDMIELMFAADDEFGLMERLAVSENDWIGARTVADLIALLEKAGAR